MALLSKLLIICIIRFQSPEAYMSASTSSKISLTPFCVLWQNCCSSCKQISVNLTGRMLNFKESASSEARSRISLNRFSNISEFRSMISAYWFFSSVDVAKVISLENPTIALSGVRISWLMFARKADFSRSDSSALTLAAFSSFCCCAFVCSASHCWDISRHIHNRYSLSKGKMRFS